MPIIIFDSARSGDWNLRTSVYRAYNLCPAISVYGSAIQDYME